MLHGLGAAHSCVLSDLPGVKQLQRLLLQLSLGLCQANSMTPAVFCVLLAKSCVVVMQCLRVALVPCIMHTQVATATLLPTQ